MANIYSKPRMTKKWTDGSASSKLPPPPRSRARDPHVPKRCLPRRRKKSPRSEASSHWKRNNQEPSANKPLQVNFKNKTNKFKKKITMKQKEIERGEVLFPIQSFSPLRFLYMGRCSWSPTFYFVSCWGRRSFSTPLICHARCSPLFFCFVHGIVVRSSSWTE